MIFQMTALLGALGVVANAMVRGRHTKILQPPAHVVLILKFPSPPTTYEVFPNATLLLVAATFAT